MDPHWLDGLRIALVQPQEIIDLRHRILRTGLPVETASFPGDEDIYTLHFGVWHEPRHEREIICCATFMLNEFEGRTAWQLRGMATDEAYRGFGLGRRLLLYAEMSLSDMLGQVTLLWCNARESAIPFYEKNGWKCVSDLFDIPTAGMHRKMTKEMAPST
jgi:GNAT superfamily N-acetyltransferase